MMVAAIVIVWVADGDEIARLVCRDPRSEPVGRSMVNVIFGGAWASVSTGALRG